MSYFNATYFGGSGGIGSASNRYFAQSTLLEDLQPIIQGDDYVTPNAIMFTVPAPAGYTTDAVVTFGGHKRNCDGTIETGWLVTGAFVVVNNTWVLTFDLDSDITDALDDTSLYDWSVQATEDDNELTLKKSDFKRPVRVLKKQT